jgi:FtsH-binding integral membrane protein
LATALTAVMVIALTVYALTTKTDFTMCGGFLMVMLFVVFAAGLLNLFFKCKWLMVAISAATIILYSIFLIFDT